MLLENHPLKWALVLKQGAESRKKRATAERCRNPGAHAANGWPHFCSAISPHHTLFKGSGGSSCALPFPCWCEDLAPSPGLDPWQLVALEPQPHAAPVCPTHLNRQVCGRQARAPSSSRGVSAGREAFSKARLQRAGSRGAKRKVQSWVHTCPGEPTRTAHSGKGSPTPGSVPPVSHWQKRGR